MVAYSYKDHGSTGVRMAIQTGGNVGIGTTSPGAKLHIDVVAEDNQPAFKITKVSDSGENAMEVYHGTSSALRGIADFTNSLGSVMFLRGDGNVGIGTTSPSAKLDVRTANGNTQSLRIGRIDAASYWDFNHAGNDLRIYNNGGTGQDILLGVNAAGTIYDNKVGIGAATPSQKLHVDGNARVTGAYYDSNNSPGTSGQILSSTVTGADWIDNAHIPSPAPATPGSIVSTIVGQTIEIAFNQSATANIDYYQVWSSDDGGDYGIIAKYRQQTSLQL